jgi:hypothetical protein
MRRWKPIAPGTDARLFARVLVLALMLLVSVASAALFAILAHEKAPFFYANF